MLSLSRAVLSPYLIPLDVAVMAICDTLTSSYNNRFWEIRNKFVECNATAYKDPAIAEEMSKCEKQMLKLSELAQSSQIPLLKVPCTADDCLVYWFEANTLEVSPLKQLAETGVFAFYIAKRHLIAIMLNMMVRDLFSGLRRG